MNDFCIIPSAVATGGGTPERPPPRKSENCCRNLVLSSRDIYFRRGVRNPRNSYENLWKKVNFPMRFWSKNLKIWLKFFKVFFIFGPNLQSFAGRLFNFPCPMEIILHMLMIFPFSTNFSRISPNISRILIPFPIVILHLSFLSFFPKYFK